MSREPKFFDMKEFQDMMKVSAYTYDDNSEVRGICYDWLNYDYFVVDNKVYPASMEVVS